MELVYPYYRVFGLARTKAWQRAEAWGSEIRELWNKIGDSPDLECGEEKRGFASPIEGMRGKARGEKCLWFNDIWQMA